MSSGMDIGNDSQNGEESKRQGLVTVNDLNYVLDPDLSVAVNKTHKKHFFQSSTYTSGQRGICIFNSGADYIDTRRSFLMFDVEIKAPLDADGHFGACGSACNMIDSITISTRSGDEISRITDFGLLQNMMLPLMYGDEWFKNQGDLMGYRSHVDSTRTPENILPPSPAGAALFYTANPNPHSGGGNKFIIPLYVLSPFFQYGRLLPAMIMSGLRIEIEWQKPSKAFIGMTDRKVDDPFDTYTYYHRSVAITEYEIKDPQFSLCSIQLSDSIQRALNEQSATNGLELVFTDYERTESTYQGAVVSTNTEVRKSCSRALKAFARVRCVNSAVEDSMKDSFRAEQRFPFVEYQWQLGSLYFPQQPVKNVDPRACAVEAYAHTLEAVDKLHGESQPPILSFSSYTRAQSDGCDLYSFMYNPRDVIPEIIESNTQSDIFRSYKGMRKYHIASKHGGKLEDPACINYGQPGTYVNDQHVLAVNLERSTLFNLAGVPVNNSRVLALRASMVTESGETRGINPFKFATDYTNAKVDRRIITIFLKYVKLARVFLNNVEVEQ